MLAVAAGMMTSMAAAQQSAGGSTGAAAELSTSTVLQTPINQTPQLPPDLASPTVTPPAQTQRTTREIGPAIAPDSADAHASKSKNKYDVTRIGERGVGSGLNVYSIERERAFGRHLADEVEQSSRMVTDPAINDYINRLGQTLVRNSDARVPFTIRIIDNDEVNAFALPGGFFYINTGLILAAENEAGLAGVMAHEIAHVCARHATRTATRAQIANLASIPLIFIGGPAAFAVRQAMGVAMPMSFLKFSRDAEREADLLGMEYAYASGYDPAEFVHFFETLRLKDKNKHHNLIAKAFSTHPMTDDRIKRAQLEIQTMLPAKDEYVVTTSEFQEMKARLANLSHRATDAHGDEVPVLRRRGNDTRSSDSTDEQRTSEGDDRPRLHKH